MANGKTYSIGMGVLTWNACKRRSDRYGYVCLLNQGSSGLNNTGYAPMNFPRKLAGKPCSLLARIIETRKSTHIGDLFHGISPRIPKVGSTITLESGLLDFSNFEPPSIGLVPVENRETEWLNIRSLYDCHEQTVELIVQED